jgi:hypothetical protein
MRQTRQSGSMRGVWKQGPRYGCSDTARRKGRKRIRRTYSSLRHTPTLPLKPLRAGMPGDSGVLVVTRVRSTNTSAHEAAGATGIRHSPRPQGGGKFLARPGRFASRGREGVFDNMSTPHSQSSSPANGSAEWPPDDRLRRAIQYSETLEHDPEKWVPVFRKDHAQTKR